MSGFFCIQHLLKKKKEVYYIIIIKYVFCDLDYFFKIAQMGFLGGFFKLCCLFDILWKNSTFLLHSLY